MGVCQRTQSWRLAVVVGTVVVAAATLVPDVGSAAASRPTAEPQGSLSAVSADSSTDAWAVGSAGIWPAAVHWDGATWGRPIALHVDGDLVAVDAVSPRDAWAAGTSYGVSGKGSTVIEHWDGAAWTRTPSVDPGGRFGTDLYGISATSATDAWAVGDYAIDKRGTYDTLIEHWDGSAWSQVPSPNPGGKHQNFLWAVTAISSTDAWALGTYGTHNANVRTSMILHWDGTSWTKVSDAPLGPNVDLQALSASSATDVWAVGVDTRGAFAVHWDGTAWKRVGVPGGDKVNLVSVSAATPSQAWAVGSVHRQGAWRTATFHWDGAGWAAVDSPSPGGNRDSELSGVAAISDSLALAVGDYYSAHFHDNPLTLTWDGQSWSQP